MIDYLDNQYLMSRLQSFSDCLTERLIKKPQESFNGTESSYWLCDLDDYVATVKEINRAESLGNAVVYWINQAVSEQGLPLQMGNVYFWRCDEYIMGLSRLIKWNIEKEFLLKALKNAIHSLLQWIHESGEYYSIYYPKMKFYLPITFSQGGGTLEALWNVSFDIEEDEPELSKEIRRKVHRSLEFWQNSRYFLNYGLFPCKEGKILKFGHLLSHQSTDGAYAHANNCGIYTPASKAVLDNFKLIYRISHSLRTSLFAKIMKDNSNLAYAFLTVGSSYTERYSNTINKWISRMNQIELQGLTPMYWHPYYGPSKPELKVSHTHLSFLINYYWLIEKDEQKIDLAVRITRLVLKKFRMRNGLLAERSDEAATYFDSQTDMCVALCKLSEITGDPKWHQEAIDLTIKARKYHDSKEGYVLSVDDKGDIVNPTVSPRFNFLHAKSQIALENVGNIRTNKNVFDSLEDR